MLIAKLSSVTNIKQLVCTHSTLNYATPVIQDVALRTDSHLVPYCVVHLRSGMTLTSHVNVRLVLHSPTLNDMIHYTHLFSMTVLVYFFLDHIFTNEGLISPYLADLRWTKGTKDVLSRFSKTEGKDLQYSLPSAGPGADPCVQAVSPQMTF